MVANTNFFNISFNTYVCLFFLLLVTFLLLWLDTNKELLHNGDDAEIKIEELESPHLVCYYTFNDTDLMPELIQPDLCSHIIVGFAGIESNNFSIYLSDLQLRVLTRLVSVMSQHKNVKTLISVGGAGLSSFGPMVVNHAHRKLFIRSLISLLKNFKMDGVDLDWEWPVIDGGAKQKVQFIQLLQEIRTEFDRHKKKYTLSAAVAAVESIVSASYYVQHIAEHVDFVNVMTYDYHFYNKYYPVTDYNAPLYSDPKDSGGAMATFNVNYTIHLWISSGMPANKIVLGLPSFGHTFRLRNWSNHKRLAPAEDFGFGTEGFASYSEVCEFLLSSPFTTVVHDTAARVPYAYDYTNWVSFDNAESLSEKTQYAKDMGLKGVMFYSLNSDDFSGNYSNKVKYPLLKAVNLKLLVT